MFNIPLATLLLTGGNFILAGQNVNYNRLAYRELQHSHHENERYHDEVLALLKGKSYNERADHMHKFVEYLEKEIAQLIDSEKEAFEQKGGLTVSGQNALHILLENRKHVMKLREEWAGAAPAAVSMSGTAKPGYFVGGEQ